MLIHRSAHGGGSLARSDHHRLAARTGGKTSRQKFLWIGGRDHRREQAGQEAGRILLWCLDYHDGTMVHVLDDLEIPDEELTFTTSRSSGPGGQNVNKLSTRVTLLFNVDDSPRLSVEQRGLLRLHLAGRISRAGVLRVVSQRHRTQLANKDAAVARFAELLRGRPRPKGRSASR